VDWNYFHTNLDWIFLKCVLRVILVLTDHLAISQFITLTLNGSSLNVELLHLNLGLLSPDYSISENMFYLLHFQSCTVCIKTVCEDEPIEWYVKIWNCYSVLVCIFFFLQLLSFQYKKLVLYPAVGSSGIYSCRLPVALPRFVMTVNGIFCMCVQMLCFGTRVPVLTRTVILWLNLLCHII